MSSSNETVKVPVSELCPDMILSKDAVSKNGVIVLAKNTRLDNITYKKLKKTEDISYIEIWAYSIDKKNKPFSDENRKKDVEKEVDKNEPENLDNPVLQKPEFKRFKQTYDKKIDELKVCTDALKNGEEANQEELFEIVDSILGTAKCSSELVQYISYLDKMDDSTYSHSINVAVLSHICAVWMHLDKKEIEKAAVAGLLHDIGKTAIDLDPKDLSNGGYLTGDKLFKYRMHPEIGYEILLYQNFDDDIKQAVLTHHEKIDGSGYPKGLKADDISLISNIVAICDTYDNLVSIKKNCPFDIITDFQSMNIGLLDTKTLIQFTKNIAYTYISSYVKLSNGKTAQVAFINPNFLSRPIVAVSDGTILDLSYNKTVRIIGMA